MKVAAVVCSTLLLVAALGNVAAVAQTLPHFQHIVLVIQENRTPDNLFGAAPSWFHCGQSDPFETGVDIQDGGPDGSQQGKPELCLKQRPLKTCWDIDHTHVAWNHQAHITLDNNNNPVANMDLACTNQGFSETQDCTKPTDCPQYSFVQKSDVQPYFDIATNYGFANYMFATNEGPSFPAHQFLLSGTSAPTAPFDLNNYYLYLAGENGLGSCDSASYSPAYFIDWTGTDFTDQNQPPAYRRPCFEHQTLADQLDQHDVTWRYYTPGAGSIWTAVNSILHLCYTNTQNPPLGTQCDSYDWTHKVVFPQPGGTLTSVPVLADIRDCHLQQVSWVIPDGRWSDHAGQDLGLGPSYVADIVDAIGDSTCTDQVGNSAYTYWQDTAIFILWDDWGGWYDHVAPPSSMILRQISGSNDCANPSQTWGCGNTYGFRVPLLVVSAYTPAGYVSGNTNIPGEDSKYPIFTTSVAYCGSSSTTSD